MIIRVTSSYTNRTVPMTRWPSASVAIWGWKATANPASTRPREHERHETLYARQKFVPCCTSALSISARLPPVRPMMITC